MPILSTAPSSLAAPYGTAASITMGISDSDTLAGTITATITATGGTLQTAGTAGTISGAGTASLSFTGTQSQINTDLGQISFTDATTAVSTISLTVTDSDGNTAGRTIAVTPVLPTPPTSAPPLAVSWPRSLAATVGASAAMQMIVVDNDSLGGSLLAVIHANTGIVATSGTAGTISGNGSGSLSISGSQSQVDADLALLSYTSSAAGNDTITYTASDSDHNVIAKTIPVTIVASDPAFGVISVSAPATLAATPGTAASFQVAFSDPDSLAGAMTAMVFTNSGSVATGGTAGSIAGNNSTALTISGSQAEVNADLASLTYTGHAAGSDTITVRIADSDQHRQYQAVAVTLGTSTPGSGHISLSGPTSLAATPGTAAALQLAISDSDSLATRVTASVHANVGSLATGGTAGTIAGNNSGSLNITGSLASVNADLATLAYTAQNAGTDSVTIAITDSDNNSENRTLPVSIGSSTTGTGRILMSAPTSLAVTTGTAAALAVAFSDSDHQAGTILAVVRDSNGNLATSGTAGTVTGNGSGTLSIAGSQSDVNADLRLLSYTGRSTGSDTIAISVMDSDGNTANQSVAVSPSTSGTTSHLYLSAPHNLASYAGVPAPLTLAFVDNDSLAGTMSATFQAQNGTVITNASVPGVSGNGTATLSFTGTLAQAQSLFTQVGFAPAQTGTASVTISLADSDHNSISSTVSVNSVTPLTANTGGTVGGFDPSASQSIDLTSATTSVNLGTITGDDLITVGSAGASFVALAGNDLVTIPTGVTGLTFFIEAAGNHTVNAASGTNMLVGGSGSDVFSITGGSGTLFTGSGQSTINIAGGSTTILASQGTSTIADNASPLLLGVLGGSHQVTLTGGAPLVLETGGSSTVTASAANAQLGLFGGTHQITLGSGGGMILQLGATATIEGGSGVSAIDLVAGHTQLTNGSGLTELFVNGGSNTLIAQQNGGNVIVLGYSAAQLAIDIPHLINGNNFTSASQVAVTHDASGNTLLDLGPTAHGEQFIILAGISSFNAAAITLI